MHYTAQRQPIHPDMFSGPHNILAIQKPLLRNPHRRHTHTRTHAHTRHAHLLARPLQLPQQRTDLPRPRTTQRMPKRNRPSLGIYLLDRQTQFLDAPHALTRKRLVDLEDVDVVFTDARLLQRHGDRFPRSDAHQQRLHAHHAAGDVFADDRLPQPLRRASLHEQDCRRTVGDLTRVPGVYAPVLGEGGLDFRQTFRRDAGPDAVVVADRDFLLFVCFGIDMLGPYRRDLAVEMSRLLGFESFLVRRCGESVLIGARDASVFGHLLGQDTHGNLAVLSFRMAL